MDKIKEFVVIDENAPITAEEKVLIRYIGTEYKGHLNTEEELFSIFNEEIMFVDEKITDRVTDEDTPDLYVMCSVFETMGSKQTIRFYYGNITEMISYVSVE